MKKEKVLKQVEIMGRTFCIGSLKETVEVIPDIVKHISQNLKG